MSVSKSYWPDFTFPPLNLWNMPKHSEIVRLINEYYYEHYKWLWEEDQKEGTPFKATLVFDDETREITGIMK